MKQLISNFFILFAFSIPASAYDLGSFGDSYPIEEASITKVMAIKASGVDAEEVAQEKKKEAKQWLTDAPAHYELRVAKEVSVTAIKHRLKMASDMNVPALIDPESGDIIKAPRKPVSYYEKTSHTIAEKGDIINPMDRPGFADIGNYLVFDPEIESQRDFIRRFSNSSVADRYTLVSVGGNILDMSKTYEKPVHLLFPSLGKIYDLNSTISVLKAGKIDGENVLLVKELPKKLYSSDSDIKSILSTDNFIKSGNYSEKTLTKTFNPKKVMKQYGAPEYLTK